MGFVVAYSKATGVQHWVPEHFFDEGNEMLRRGLTRDVPDHVEVPGDEQGGAPVVAPQQPDQPEPPSMDWTKDELEGYASQHGVDLTGASVKKDILAAIEKAAPPPLDNPALDAIGVAHPGPGGETASQDADASDQSPADISPTPQTPATGENQE